MVWYPLGVCQHAGEYGLEVGSARTISTHLPARGRSGATRAPSDQTALLLSYNNKGIIPIEDLETILKKYGIVYKIPVEHKTYNKLKGIASYKRKKTFEEVKEFIWLVDFR